MFPHSDVNFGKSEIQEKSLNLFIFDTWASYNNDDFKLITQYNDIVKGKYLKKYLFANKHEHYNFIIVMVSI